MNGKKRVTIKDVARETGLAFSTVSNALADKGYVRAETKALVLDAARRLGYRASTVARALRTQRSFSIGVLIADVSNPSSADFVRGVEDILNREHCSMLLCNTDGDEQRQIACMRTLLDHQVDGMVLISQHCDSAVIRDLLAGGPPAVFVQRRAYDFPADYVGADNYNGIIDAMRHVHALGHRRVGFIRGPADSSSAQERQQTFVREAAQLNFDPSQELIFPGEYTFNSGVTAAAYFLRLNPPPTCIMASSDVNALGLMQYLMDTGLKIPQDISVVGLDDIALASFKTINLTTIHLRKREIGAEAASLLLERIEDPNLPFQARILPTQLVVRGTTAAPALVES